MHMGALNRLSPRTRSRLLAVLVLCAASAVLPVAGAAPQEEQIKIDHFAFTPANMTVPVGTTVRWTNADGTLHTVTSSTGAFASEGLDQGGVFSHTFSAPGSFPYYCKLHPSMTGTIIVK